MRGQAQLSKGAIDPWLWVCRPCKNSDNDGAIAQGFMRALFRGLSPAACAARAFCRASNASSQLQPASPFAAPPPGTAAACSSIPASCPLACSQPSIHQLPQLPRTNTGKSPCLSGPFEGCIQWRVQTPQLGEQSQHRGMLT